MRTSPFLRFSNFDVLDILRDAALPLELSEANLARVGLMPIRTQRDRVLAAYQVHSDVDDIFDALGGDIPKSSIRSYLCREFPNGQWRQRRRRSSPRQSIEGAA